MRRTALPLPTNLTLYGTENVPQPSIGFRLENNATANSDKACFSLRSADGNTTIAFPMTLSQLRDFGVSCIAYAMTGSQEGVFLSHGPGEVVINGETMLCTSFVFSRTGDMPHLMVFRHPSDTKGAELKPLVQIPLTRDQFRDLGIRSILYAETH